MEDGSGVRTRTWTVRRPPLSPPAGVAPFAGVGNPYSQPPWAASLRPRKPLAPGPSPRNPTFEGVRLRDGWLAVGVMGGLRWGVTDGVRWRDGGVRWASGMACVGATGACGGRHGWRWVGGTGVRWVDGRRASARRGSCGRDRWRVLGAMGGGCWRDGGAAVWVRWLVAAVPGCFTGSVSQIQTGAILAGG